MSKWIKLPDRSTSARISPTFPGWVHEVQLDQGFRCSTFRSVLPHSSKNKCNFRLEKYWIIVNCCLLWYSLDSFRESCKKLKSLWKKLTGNPTATLRSTILFIQACRSNSIAMIKIFIICIWCITKQKWMKNI